MSTHKIRKSLLTLGGILLSSLSAQAQLAGGLINYWPLEGDATDVAEAIPGSGSTSADDGMVNGSVSFVPGMSTGFGNAGNFPGGGGNNITIADPDSGTNDIDRSGADLTISAWFLLNNRDTVWQALIAHGEEADYRIAVRSDLNPIPMAYAGGGSKSDIETTSTVGTGPAGDATWHHIVVTTEGSATQIFLDGVLEASGGTGEISENGENLLCIGCNPTNGREWNGLIDDIGMWDRALTAAEVTQIYDAGVAGNPLSTLFVVTDGDGDGLPDEWEILHGLDPTDPGTGNIDNGPGGDPDGDTVSNFDEYNDGSNSTSPVNDDSDGDTLTDDIETNTGMFVDATNTGTNPNKVDSDNDGLDDNVEDTGGTNNGATMTGSNPNLPDTDGDAIPDGYEITNMLDPNIDDSLLDPDTDQLDNVSEFEAGTDPQVPDTDMDGVNDGPEVNTYSSDPLVIDTDGDTLSDGDEVNTHMTDPTMRDTDGDLFSDLEELTASTDPNDPNSKPAVRQLPDPLLYYTFDVDNGTEVENLGTLATAGVLQGAATYGPGQDASFGTAFVGNRSDTNDAYVATGISGDDLGFGANGTYTAMAWINWAGSEGDEDHIVFGQDDGGGDNPQLHHGIRDDSSPANIHFGGWGTNQDISDAGAVPANTWTHVAWQYDGTEKVVFVDGVETARAGGDNIANSALNVIIGAHGRDSNLNPAPGQSFNGSLDEVKIYGSALTPAQVREAMTPSGASADLKITDCVFDPNVGASGHYSLTFTSRLNGSYRLFTSNDLIDFSDEVDSVSPIVGADGSTTVVFPHPDPGVSKIFFRVETN